MRIRNWPLMLILAVLLAACGSSPIAEQERIVPVASIAAVEATQTPVIVRETVVVEREVPVEVVVTATALPTATSTPSPTATPFGEAFPVSALPIYTAPDETTFTGAHYDGIELIGRYGNAEWVLINTEMGSYWSKKSKLIASNGSTEEQIQALPYILIDNVSFANAPTEAMNEAQFLAAGSTFTLFNGGEIYTRNDGLILIAIVTDTSNSSPRWVNIDDTGLDAQGFKDITPPPPTAIPTTARPAQTGGQPAEQAKLRFSIKNRNEGPSCMSVEIIGINPAGWTFSIDGTGLVATFGGKDARICGITAYQELTFSIKNRNNQVIRGGGGVPIRGGDIMTGTWR